jgi:type II secretory pathway pseudopilin PulG
MLKFKPLGMDIQASPLTAGGNMSAAALPIIGLTTTATTGADAQRLNDDVRLALEDYLRQQQRRSGTPTTDRVVVSIVDRPGPMLMKGHSINLGIVALLLVLVATIAVVYLLENVRVQRQSAANTIWDDVEARTEQRLFNAQDEFADSRLQAGPGARPEHRSAL